MYPDNPYFEKELAMERWIIDPNHSSAVFEVRHMMVTWIIGRFNKVSGTLQFDPSQVAKSSVDAEIEASSICTGNDQRDDDLKSENYLDVKQFPKITFRSRLVEPAGLDHCKVEGDLFIHGVIRPVSLDVRYAGPSHYHYGPRYLTTFGFRASTEINREDYGITTNREIENGGLLVGKQLFIILTCEANLEGE
jgi:polyisoprenoid-binding protein YceI